MHSDQRQPGWNVYLPICPPATLTSSTVVLSGVRVSSGESNVRLSTPAISPPKCPVPDGLSATTTQSHGANPEYVAAVISMQRLVHAHRDQQTGQCCQHGDGPH